MNRLRKFLPYWQAIPEILRYQVVSKFFLGILLMVLNTVTVLLLLSTGRLSISTGDFAFLFTTWQGPLLIAAAVFSLFLFVAFDLNTKIVYAEKLMQKQPVSVMAGVREGVLAVRRLFTPAGTGVVIYIALIAPIIGLGISISLTENLAIPNFISSVIVSTPLYSLLYTAAIIVFASVGVAHLFCLHAMVIDHLSVKEALQRSRSLMKAHWKDFLRKSLGYALVFIFLDILIVLVLMILPYLLAVNLSLSKSVTRGLLVFQCLTASGIFGALQLLATPFYLMRITELYHSYRDGTPASLPVRQRKMHPFRTAAVILLVSAIAGAVWLVNSYFDRFFPLSSTVQVIAHRAGGSEAPENTIAGLEKAIETGAYGAEIDIQRTKDGYYIVNHDNDFKRTCGVGRTPEEMTLAEIQQLTVRYDKDPDIHARPASFEEMLEKARGNLVLFVELKGRSADEQMVDDAVRLIRSCGMEQETVLISLKYSLINYAETNYPDIATGYLTFASYGDISALNCDYLGIEEETATMTVIDAIHSAGKKVMVWTPNTEESQYHFLLTEADAVITDEISQAQKLIENMERRDDLTRIIDGIFR